MISNSQINDDRCNEVTSVWCIARHRGFMPNKDRPLVERHSPKDGEGWLMNDQEQKLCSFTNANPTAHAQWVIVETRPLRGSGQPVVRRMLRQMSIEPWETMLKSGGCHRFQPRW